ncbi:MAG: hypothetical protein KA712_03380 [Myxococcales bacterium]|nr:hypothetical protein [Myxococcales bacterium]
MRPWTTLDRVDTPEGPLELRQRGEKDFLITIDSRVLMTSSAHRSEDALAVAACEPLLGLSKPRVLIGGLGMGFTLRAALDHLPADARVDVVDLNERVVAWCRGPLAPLTHAAVLDPRVKVSVGDVAHTIARAPAGHYDAIVIDLYEGPHHALNGPRDPLYGTAALALTHHALAPRGIFAVWSEEPDRPFEQRMAAAGFSLARQRSGQGGRLHAVYVGEKQRLPIRPPRDLASPPPRPSGRRPPKRRG